MLIWVLISVHALYSVSVLPLLDAVFCEKLHFFQHFFLLNISQQMLNEDYLFHYIVFFFLIKEKISTCKTANMITFFNINSMHITDLLCPLVEKAISNFLHSSYTIIAQAKYRMYFRTNPLSASSESNTFGMRGLCTFNL